MALAFMALAVLAIGTMTVPSTAAGCDAQGHIGHSLAREHTLGDLPDCRGSASHSGVPCPAVSLCGAAPCIPAMWHSTQQLAGRFSQSTLFSPPDDLRLAEWKLAPPIKPPRLLG